MKISMRIPTGIRPSGKLHRGDCFGAIKFGRTLFAAACAAAIVVAGCSERADEAGGADLAEQARAAAESSGFRAPADGDGGELHIYTWCDYIAPEVIESFEKALGVKVVIDTFDSNEAMYAKLKAGGTGYDIIMPTSCWISLMAKEGMLDVLDHSKIPNVRQNFDPTFEKQIPDPSFKYNVPYAVTYTGFMYLKDKIPAGADVNSWSILGNPAMKNRVSLIDDVGEVIGGALMYLGYPIDSKDPKEIDAAVAQILKWRANVRKFDSESYKTEVPSGATWIAIGFSTDAMQVIIGDEESGVPARTDIGFALPKEGFSVAFDEMAIPKDAKRKDLAYAFINYIYDGDVAVANMNYICGANPVKPGIDKLDDDYRKLIIPDKATLMRGHIFTAFNDPAVIELYNRAWDRIRAASVK